MSRWSIASGFVLSIGVAWAGLAQQAPTMTIGASSIVVSGITPKASVYAFGIAREKSGYFVNVVPRQITLRDDDGDGSVEWAIGSAIDFRSIWMAVDLSNGQYVAAAPQAYGATRVPLSDQHLRGAGADVTQLAFPGTFVELLVVRPGTGAWRSVVGLHGPQDEGNDADKITVSTLRLEPQGDNHEPGPRQLKKDDVVFFVNSSRAEYGIVRIGEKQ
jgi:hypothetical protein